MNDQYALLAFVKLAMRLVNDESSVCKRMIILAMQQLVKSVSDSKRNDLFLASQDWLKSKKVDWFFFNFEFHTLDDN